jgi:hypothetical protein
MKKLLYPLLFSAVIVLAGCSKDEEEINPEQLLFEKLKGTWVLQSCYNTMEYVGKPTTDTLCQKCTLLDMDYDKYTLTFTPNISPAWSNIVTHEAENISYNQIIGTVIEKGEFHEYSMPFEIMDFTNNNKFTIWGLAPYMDVLIAPNSYCGTFFHLSGPQFKGSYDVFYGADYINLHVIEFTDNSLCVNFFLGNMCSSIANSKWHIAYYVRK